jgi:hypothetical protein
MRSTRPAPPGLHRPGLHRPGFHPPGLHDDPLGQNPTLAALVAFALGWVALAWPWLSGRFTIPWDAKAHFLPQIQFLAGSLARGESPSWNPYVFSGHPQIADPQSMIFSPPFLALAAVDANPSMWAVDATVFLSILAAGCALVVWCRDQNWHWAGATLAALAFGFGAAMAWRIQHTGQVLSLCWLPVTLLLLERALRQGSWGYGLAAGIAGAFLVLGRDQVALLGVYLLAAYAVWWMASSPDRGAELRKAVLPLGLGGIAGLLIIAIPVLLTAALSAGSNRPGIDIIGAGRGSLHPALGLTFFTPDLFGSKGRMWDYWGPPSFAWSGTDLFIAQNMGQLYLGAVPALLILIGLGSGALFRREIVFFTGALAVMVLYALGWFTPFFTFAHIFLPGVSFYRRPADAVFLIGFLGAILAGFGAHLLLSNRLSHRQLVWGSGLAAALVAAALLAGLAVAIRMEHIGAATAPLLMGAAMFAVGAAIVADAVWFNPIRPLLAAALLLGFTVLDLGFSNGPGSATAAKPSSYDMLEPATNNETIAILKRKTAEGLSDTRRDRVELVGLGFAWPNASITHRLENTLGYNPVRLGLYSQATGAEDTVGLPEQRKFSPMFPSYRSQLADLLGLRYIATSVPLAKLDAEAPPADFPIVAMTADGYIYENPRAFPRALFAASAAPADFDAILNTGKWPDDDLHGTVLLSSDDEKTSGLVATRGTGAVRIVKYSNTVVEIEVESTRGGYVVLNDLWHPWWVASIDKEPAPVLRANVLFRAVRVAKGRHIVRFTFAPIHRAFSAIMSP